MNEVLTRKQADRGNRADSLLKNELLKEYWEVTGKSLVAKWMESQNPQERDDLWRAMRILKNMETYMEKIVITGKDATKQLVNLKNPTKLSQIIKRI